MLLFALTACEADDVTNDSESNVDSDFILPEGAVGICSVEDLSKIGVDDAYPVDGYYALAKDITLTGEWQPIGSASTTKGSSTKFEGTFDGFGHTISGLKITSSDEAIGLFSSINRATIKNVIIKNPEIVSTSASSTVGGVVGSVGRLCTIEGCSVVGGTIKGSGVVGGVVGSCSGGSITSCSNSATVISDEGTAGGIVGQTGFAAFSDCTNEGDVSGVELVGGIIGAYTASNIYNGTSEGYIKECHNSGAVSADAYVGGIVGHLKCYYTAALDMESCSNSGTIEGSGDYVGGIAGLANVKLRHCNNSGEVSTGGSFVGGIAGGISSYSNVAQSFKSAAPSNIFACYNTGDVKSSEGSEVGGIVGSNIGSLTSSSYNTGAVSGVERVGGVAGNSEASRLLACVITCYNTAKVSGTEAVGGIAGRSCSASSSDSFNGYSAPAYLISSFNVGGVYGSTNVGDAAGINHSVGSSAIAYISWCSYLEQPQDDAEMAVGANSGYGTAEATTIKRLNGQEETYLADVNAYAESIATNNDIEALLFTPATGDYLPSLMGENILYSGK